jgi:hypothetical protein
MNMNLHLNTNACRSSLLLKYPAIAFSVFLVAIHVQAINLVVNGSFENGSGASVPGWSRWYSGPAGQGGPGIYGTGQYAGANTTDGTQALDLGLYGYGAPAGISQTFLTVPGQQYVLSFDWGSEYGWGVQGFVAGTNNGVQLFETALSESARSAYPTTSAGVPWIVHHEELSFTADANSVTLAFYAKYLGNPALDFGGLVLDNVAVEATAPSCVPDHGHTLLLMGCTLTGLSLAGKRRKDVSACLGF